MAIHSFAAEPTGEAYFQLIRAALLECGAFGFVLRLGVAAAEATSADASLFDRLAGHVVARVETIRWPGTRAFPAPEPDRHGEADAWFEAMNEPLPELCLFRFDEESAKVLGEVVRGLYDWDTYGLPEDLHFYDRRGRPWMYSVAHERMGGLELTDDALAQLRFDFPELAACLAAPLDQA